MSKSLNEDGLRAAVMTHWKYHGKSRQIFWSSGPSEQGEMRIISGPVFQEIFGGEEDGKRVWVAFQFDVTGLAKEPGVEITSIEAMSYCLFCDERPYVALRGKYKGHRFSLRLYLEPIPESGTREILDTIKNQIRTIEEHHD